MKYGSDFPKLYSQRNTMPKKPITIKANRPDPRKLPDVMSVTGRLTHEWKMKLFHADYDTAAKIWRIVIPVKGKGIFQPLPASLTQKAIGELNGFTSEQACLTAISKLIIRIQEKLRTNHFILLGDRRVSLAELFEDDESEKG